MDESVVVILNSTLSKHKWTLKPYGTTASATPLVTIATHSYLTRVELCHHLPPTSEETNVSYSNCLLIVFLTISCFLGTY